MLEVKDDPAAAAMRADDLIPGTVGKIHEGPDRGELVVITPWSVNSLSGGDWWGLDGDELWIEPLPDGTLLEYKAPEA